MTNDEYRVSRVGWPAGSWDNEPDRFEWRYNRMPCLALRNNLGAWCGYVGLPVGHSWRRLDAHEIPVTVHWGITYGPASCSGHICHVPLPGESDDVMWIGFDCAHCEDESPGMMKYAKYRIGTYRDLSFVRAEVELLARQACCAAVLD